MQERQMFEGAKRAVHERLMQRMTETTGADLSGQEVGVLLDKCCSCGHVGSCEDWLEDHSEGAEKSPRFCKNAAVMHLPEGTPAKTARESAESF